MSAAVCFVNADLPDGRRSLRVADGRIADVGVRPSRGDLVADLGGDRLLPGLINAHEHLQFSNFPRVRYRDRHLNVAEWIADVTARRATEPSLVASEALDFTSRLFAGGIKNLLSGVTTVAHHDAWRDDLAGADFPVRVLREFGWAHSPGLCDDARLRDTHAGTPAGQVWMVHAGEGVDADAHAEFARLEFLDCLDARTRVVHALGFDGRQMARLVESGAGVIWCPSSNEFLFGRTLDPAPLLAAGRLALGSDSRLSGARDLLEELRAAQRASGLGDVALESLATRDNARLLRLADRGEFAPGMLADLIVIPAGASLPQLERSALRLVMIGGRACYGDADLWASLQALDDAVPVRVDGCDKMLMRTCVARVAACAWQEPGLELPVSLGRAA